MFTVRLKSDLFTALTTDKAQSQLQIKVNQLEAALSAREQELAAAEIRHKKAIEKTKEIFKAMDSKVLPGKYYIAQRRRFHQPCHYECLHS